MTNLFFRNNNYKTKDNQMASNISTISEQYSNSNPNFQEYAQKAKSSSKLQNSRRSKNFDICFLCSVEDCQQLFKTEKELQSHKLSHQKLFNCSYEGCHKIFCRKINFQKHLKKHCPSKRKYICSFPGCQKKYTAPHNLAIHYRHHTGNKPYVCEKCGMFFFYQGARRYHIKAKHDKLDKDQTMCKHKGCDYKSKTAKLKLMHHGILEPECVNEKSHLLNLLINFHKNIQELVEDNTFINLPKNNESEKSNSDNNNNIKVKEENYKLKKVFDDNKCFRNEIMEIKKQSKVLLDVCIDKDQYIGIVGK